MGVEVMVTVAAGTVGRMMILLVRVNTLHVHIIVCTPFMMSYFVQ